MQLFPSTKLKHANGVIISPTLIIYTQYSLSILWSNSPLTTARQPENNVPSSRLLWPRRESWGILTPPSLPDLWMYHPSVPTQHSRGDRIDHCQKCNWHGQKNMKLAIYTVKCQGSFVLWWFKNCKNVSKTENKNKGPNENKQTKKTPKAMNTISWSINIKTMSHDPGPQIFWVCTVL